MNKREVNRICKEPDFMARFNDIEDNYKSMRKKTAWLSWILIIGVIIGFIIGYISGIHIPKEITFSIEPKTLATYDKILDLEFNFTKNSQDCDFNLPKQEFISQNCKSLGFQGGYVSSLICEGITCYSKTGENTRTVCFNYSSIPRNTKYGGYD